MAGVMAGIDPRRGATPAASEASAAPVSLVFIGLGIAGRGNTGPAVAALAAWGTAPGTVSAASQDSITRVALAAASTVVLLVRTSTTTARPALGGTATARSPASAAADSIIPLQAVAPSAAEGSEVVTGAEAVFEVVVDDEAAGGGARQAERTEQ